MAEAHPFQSRPFAEDADSGVGRFVLQAGPGVLHHALAASQDSAALPAGTAAAAGRGEEGLIPSSNNRRPIHAKALHQQCTHAATPLHHTAHAARRCRCRRMCTTGPCSCLARPSCLTCWGCCLSSSPAGWMWCCCRPLSRAQPRSPTRSRARAGPPLLSAPAAECEYQAGPATVQHSTAHRPCCQRSCVPTVHAAMHTAAWLLPDQAAVIWHCS